MEGRQALLQFSQANREQDAAIPGGMKLSRGSNASFAVHEHAQELPWILVSSDVATPPTFATIAAEDEEPGDHALSCSQ